MKLYNLLVKATNRLDVTELLDAIHKYQLRLGILSAVYPNIAFNISLCCNMMLISLRS
jgi:hypothetical protein